MPKIKQDFTRKTGKQSKLREPGDARVVTYRKKRSVAEESEAFDRLEAVAAAASSDDVKVSPTAIVAMLVDAFCADNELGEAMRALVDAEEARSFIEDDMPDLLSQPEEDIDHELVEQVAAQMYASIEPAIEAVEAVLSTLRNVEAPEADIVG